MPPAPKLARQRLRQECEGRNPTGNGYKGTDFEKLRHNANPARFGRALKEVTRELGHYADFAKAGPVKLQVALKIPPGQPLPKEFLDAIAKIELDRNIVIKML